MMLFLLMSSWQIFLSTPSDKIPLNVEVPENQEERQIGLSRTQKISKDEGMLFIMPSEDMHLFTMRETSIPLLFLFFDENKNLVDVQLKKPHDPFLVSPKRPAKYVLEAHPDLLKDYNFTDNHTTISFKNK